MYRGYRRLAALGLEGVRICRVRLRPANARVDYFMRIRICAFALV